MITYNPPLPYYQDQTTTLYHGDSREILPALDFNVLITDPTWPNATVPLYGSSDPERMMAEILLTVPADVTRYAVHLGCDSDPRFLTAVPRRWEFFRVVWLEYIRPSYKGRLLYTSDVAYLFGPPPASRKGGESFPAGSRRPP